MNQMYDRLLKVIKNWQSQEDCFMPFKLPMGNYQFRLEYNFKKA